MSKTPGRLITVVFLLVLASFAAFAQSSAPVITENTEYEIGFDCPAAQVLSPDGDALWVLTQGCFTGVNALRAFSVEDGEPLNAEDAFAAEVSAIPRSSYIDGNTNPMAFLPDGRISIIYSDEETYEARRLLIDVGEETGANPTATVDEDTLNGLLTRYSDYPEATVYNADHSLAVAFGTTALHVLDLATGTELFNVTADSEEYSMFPAFAPDSRTLYVAQLINPEDYSDYNSILTTYSLPDGSPTGDGLTVASPFMWISPDGLYSVGHVGSTDGEYAALTLTSLADGSTGEEFPLNEGRKKAEVCVNDGRSLSDYDFPKRGKLSLVSVSWLPDSSGFVFTRSYGGEGLGGGAPCALNTSRLNRLELAGPG